MHLKPEEFVDLAEGTRALSSAPHLAGCAGCRQRLAELRASMLAVRDTDVPEPVPVFWKHFSNRVGEAIAAEGTPRTLWQDLIWWPRVLIPISALAAVVTILIAAGVASRFMSPATGPELFVPAGSQLGAQQIKEDPSLGLVADLTRGLDPGEADEAGLTSASAEHAVADLNADELRELRRLLQEALANSGS
jgi:hypothetical protein